MDGLEICRRVYQRLRRPSQQALPWRHVLSTVSEVIARKRLDLALSEQNGLATTSPWFTPTSADFELESMGLSSILLPIRVERRAIDSEYETGDPVPVVNYQVLQNSLNGAVSFYGSPVRMVFRDPLSYVQEQQYRVVYETDFEDDVELGQITGLPSYFASMVVLEAAWELLDQIEDDSPEYENFVDRVSRRWEMQIADQRVQWMKYVRQVLGNVQVPKRTFRDNNRCRPRTRFFKEG